MRLDPRLSRCLAAAVLLTLSGAGAGAEEPPREVVVVNLPETQRVIGTVNVSGPTTQAILVRLQETIVSPVAPTETTALVSGGTLETAGFVSVVLSLTGRMRANLFAGGEVGAILVPDEEPIVTAFEEEGQVLFPLRATAVAAANDTAYFTSDQPAARVAFPSYRVYYFNTTDRPAAVSLFAYLTN